MTVLFTITFPPAPANLDSVLVSITDITERKRAEERYRRRRRNSLTHTCHGDG